MKIESPSPSKKNRISDTSCQKTICGPPREMDTQTWVTNDSIGFGETTHSGISIKSDDSSISILGICLPKQSFTFSDVGLREHATAVYAVGPCPAITDQRLMETPGYMVPVE